MPDLISIDNIKKLRDLTGAGLTDAKQTLQSAKSFEEAVQTMQAKGLVKAGKREARQTGAGIIESYVHDGRIGVLVEVGCETDFVAKTDDFLSFVKDLALQIAASKPEYLKAEDIPQPILDQHYALFKAQAESENYPKDKQEAIINGKLTKLKTEICLLSQSFNKDPKLTINDLLQAINAKLGENIVIKRFVRFELGESDT